MTGVTYKQLFLHASLSVSSDVHVEDIHRKHRDYMYIFVILLTYRVTKNIKHYRKLMEMSCL